MEKAANLVPKPQHKKLAKAVFIGASLFVCAGCRKSNHKGTVARKNALPSKKTVSLPPSLRVWNALMQQANAKLSETQNCHEKYFDDQRKVVDLLSTLVGGDYPAKPCQKNQPCKVEPDHAMSLECEARSEDRFACEIVTNDLDRTGDAHLALRFDFIAFSESVPIQSLVCI